MSRKAIYIGNTPKHAGSEPVRGELVTLEGESCYRIAGYDRMRPFFLSLVSDSDLWMFLSSSGGLTAGRRDPEHALFPYTTDDKIHDSRDVTGSKTLLLIERKDHFVLWEPFTPAARDAYALERNLYKSVWGNRILFEEINRDLHLTFRYAWALCHEFGCVKHSQVRNDATAPVQVRVLDGIQNLLPAGVSRFMQTERSTLVDAYKRSELESDTGLGIFRLSSLPVDRPEPSESLRATTVWSVGLAQAVHLLSNMQLETFREALPLTEETDIRAQRGAYWVQSDLSLDAGGHADWHLVAEGNQGPAEVAALGRALREPNRLRVELESSLHRGARTLRSIVARADGLQHTADRLGTARHYSNVLFNVMRGGLFEDNYAIDRGDLRQFIRQHNVALAGVHGPFLDRGPRITTVSALAQATMEQGDPQLERLRREYLPLTFSRRHGDPSRPWNTFSIEIRKPDGARNRHYAGNWRDIFQNWEALSRSFPRFIEGMIGKFLNASTADGHNPYRIGRDGIDWEVLDPSDPWSHIGYWGDHQIVYLLKLLEMSRDHHPGCLEAFLTRDLFAYANVPYRIKPYPRLLDDPHHTVDYDGAEEERIAARVRQVGSDGKLIWNRQGEVRLVNLTEKLLVWILARLANFIPGGGIWMNTQRPEWNDANNALVGYGVSMVTLCYLRRALVFCRELFDAGTSEPALVSAEVADFLTAVSDSLRGHRPPSEAPLGDEQRRAVLDALGGAGSDYRRKLYQEGFSERRRGVTRRELVSLADLALAHVDHSIRLNRRADGLYHAYNLMSVEGPDRLAINHLDEMLEGQVAVLCTGLLSATESAELLDALRSSALYRADQQSYLLYPDRQLPRFVAKNQIPAERVTQSALLKRMVNDGDRRLLVRDVEGRHHFAGDLHNARDVAAALDELSASGYRAEVDRDRSTVLALWEELFDHRSYTGRSGTFFGYEGLGCIYWHMVSKLRLAVIETHRQARARGASDAVLRRLANHYRDIRAGIGAAKSPADYGSFPIDPYSHTPGDGAVRQPGMTGQVKEDILSRWEELGVHVSHGRIRFEPRLLEAREFLKSAGEFSCVDVQGQEQRIPLEPDSLAFTYCQVPVVYRLSGQDHIVITRRDGSVETSIGLELDALDSSRVFDRSGEIVRLEVCLESPHL